jgi:hypothetical protein
MAVAIDRHPPRRTGRIGRVAPGVVAEGETNRLSTMGDDFCDF